MRPDMLDRQTALAVAMSAPELLIETELALRERGATQPGELRAEFHGACWYDPRAFCGAISQRRSGLREFERFRLGMSTAHGMQGHFPRSRPYAYFATTSSPTRASR